MARFRRRGYKRSFGKKMRIRKYKKMRVFKSEKRKLGLQGNLIYGGLPERKKMYMSNSGKIVFSADNNTGIINLSPVDCEEWLTLYTQKFGYNWDKMCVSRIYIKIIPQFNSYVSNDASKVVPNFRAFYLINPVSDENGKKLFATKQCINFEGGKTFTVLIDKPSVIADSAVVYKYGTYLSLEDCQSTVDIQKRINQIQMEEEPDVKKKFQKRSTPPDEDWGDEQESTPPTYGRFFIKCDEDFNDANTSISLRYKVFFKIHLKG